MPSRPMPWRRRSLPVTVPAPPDAWPGAMRFTTPELMELEQQIAGAPATGRSSIEQEFFDATSRGHRLPPRAAISNVPPPWPISIALRALPNSPRAKATCGRVVDHFASLRHPAAGVIRWWSSPCAVRRARLHRQRSASLRLECPRTASGSSPAPTWRANRRSCARTR